MAEPNSYRAGPDSEGRFGLYGGRYVAETLMPLILEVERAWRAAQQDPSFEAEFRYYLEHYVGRPSPLYFAERLTGHLGGAKIYFKRDELNHTGAHKINNCGRPGPARPAHGKDDGSSPRPAPVSTASPPPPSARCSTSPAPSTWAPTDMERQAPNVMRMKMLGAEVRPVQVGLGAPSRTP